MFCITFKLLYKESTDAVDRPLIKPPQGEVTAMAPGFLKLISCVRRYTCVCVCLYVSAPGAIKNYSREMKSE